MEKVAIGVGTGVVGIFAVGAGGLLGCKGSFMFAATGALQVTSLFAEGNRTKGVCV